MNHIWDKQSWTDWAYFASGGSVSFDSENAICAKTQYAIDNDLAGFIIWELSGDLLSDLSTPLLDITNKKLADPSYSCGEPGYYPEEGASASMAFPSPSLSAQQTPPTANGLGAPAQGTTPSAPTPGTVPVPSPSVGNVGTVPTPSANNDLSIVTNPSNPDSTALFLNCKDSSNPSDPKPVELSFKYELHRHPLISSTVAMQDAKRSMLNDIAKHFECQETISNPIQRGVSNLRNSPTQSVQDYIVAFMSAPQDIQSNCK